MTSKAWIFNHWGELEDTVVVSTTPRGWVLNGYGRCDFAIPLSDPACSERLLQFGNFVHIQHFPNEDEGRTVYGVLPTWTGMIVPPRTWNTDAVVVSAVSVGAVLAFRAMPFVRVEGQPQDVFTQIIRYAAANTPNTLQIFPGRVDAPRVHIRLESGEAFASYSEELRTNAYDHIKKMCNLLGMDWDVQGTINPNNNALQLTANLYDQRGRRQGGLVLAPVNSDATNPLMTEQGTPYNHIFAYNQAQTAETRIMEEVQYEDSIALYGPFQQNVVYSGITDASGVVSAVARARVVRRGLVTKKVNITALDVMDTFSFIDIGNVGFIALPTVGFNADGSIGFRSYFRILSADYSDLTNKVRLEVELIEGRTDYPDLESMFQ